MIPILLLSFLAVYLFIERWLTIKKASRIDSDFMSNIRSYMLSGNLNSAEALCKSQNTPIARMIGKGIQRIGKPLSAINASIENVGKLELYKLEKRLAVLATIAGAAPMIGFLGTVTGMIRAFYNIAKAGSTVDPGILAGGIYEALITTAAGLTVGILAYIGYNFLVTMIDRVVHTMEATSVEFIDLLQEPA